MNSVAQLVKAYEADPYYSYYLFRYIVNSVEQDLDYFVQFGNDLELIDADFREYVRLASGVK